MDLRASLVCRGDLKQRAGIAKLARKLIMKAFSSLLHERRSSLRFLTAVLEPCAEHLLVLQGPLEFESLTFVLQTGNFHLLMPLMRQTFEGRHHLLQLPFGGHERGTQVGIVCPGIHQVHISKFCQIQRGGLTVEKGSARRSHGMPVGDLLVSSGDKVLCTVWLLVAANVLGARSPWLLADAGAGARLAPAARRRVAKPAPLSLPTTC